MSSNHKLDRRRVLAGGAAVVAASFARRTLAADTTAPSRSIVATTTAGKVRGSSHDGVHVFKGIPYGADTRTTRFAAPRPVASWSGVRDALDYGPAAPQAKRAPHVLTKSWGDGSRGQSEDCLVLNVWTRGVNDGAKRPVMVWFHGGGFGAGSAASLVYDGTALTKQGDVVVIGVNHRLNAFGYLYLAEFGDSSFADSGMAGMLDLVLALQWVRDNAANFGGDPGNVTIFGESGGGGKVSYLLGMPGAEGLFHKAVVQSGAFLKGLTPSSGTQRAQKYLDSLNVSKSTLEKLRTLSTEELVTALGSAATLADRMAQAPVTDGRSLPRDPFAPAATPLSANIPLLIGTTGWEYTYQYGQEDEGNFSLSWSAVPVRLGAVMKALGIPGEVDDVISSYRKLRPDFSASDVFFAAIADGRPIANAQMMAQLKAAQAAPVYMYRLDWQTPVDGGRWKSAHALDIPFVFNNIERGVSMTGTGEVQKQLGEQMSNAWLTFARTGKPGASSLPSWPAFDARTRNTMIFDTHSRVEADPAADVRRFWFDQYRFA